MKKRRIFASLLETATAVEQSKTKKCSVRLGVRTLDFHSGNTGSNPVRSTKPSTLLMAFFICGHCEWPT